MKKIRLVIIFAVLTALLLFAATPYGGAAYGEPASVYVGGYPVGISLDVGGLLVEEVTGVETEYGTAYVEGIQKGDIIKRINDTVVSDVDGVDNLIRDCGEIKLTLWRDGDLIEVVVQPIVDLYSQTPRLGVKIKDKIFGIGTVTYVAADGKYVALGHEIYDSETGVRLPFSGGHIHPCKIIGIKRGKKGEAGAILASLVQEKIYGSVDCNNNYGISGTFEADFDKSELLPLASRSEVKPGAAKIKSDIDGKSVYYDVEIIKAARQSSRKEKGIVFRVTDKRLLEATGGVVRGMSGSPIIQNGKVIGAVTHVFLNDFTKGYGVYADFLN